MTSVFPRRIREDGVRVFQHYLHSHGSFLRPFILLFSFYHIFGKFQSCSYLIIIEKVVKPLYTNVYQLTRKQNMQLCMRRNKNLTCIYYHKIEPLFYIILELRLYFYQYKTKDNKSIIYSISICL